MPTFHTLTIKEVIKETADAVSICFDVPDQLQAAYAFSAGQYLTLKKELNGSEVRRAYSICSTPHSKQLKVAIKAVTNGTFSVHATQELQTGDSLEVATPEGQFILDPQENKDYLAFAAGSGITPILSMVKSVLESNSTARFTLIYGNKSAESTIFKTELDQLVADYADRFDLQYVYSRSKEDHALFGRIDKGHTNYFIKNHCKDRQFDATFLCGPEAMIEVVTETLVENGFSKDSIRYELFTSSSASNEVSIKEGQSQITIRLDDEETTFEMSQKDDILAASLRNQLDAPYSCQGGVCSSCLCRVVEGHAVMTKNSILTDAEVADGFVLACQAHPTTASLIVDFDDV